MTIGTAHFKTAVVGWSLAVAAPLMAQVPTPPIDATPTPTAASSTPRATGSIVDLRNTPSMPTAETRSLLQFSRLLNANIVASDGSFGRVTDVVFDRNGNIQYLLGSNRGQTFVLPYLPSAFSATGNNLTFNVPIANLQQLAIDPQNLPPMQNLAFLTRMRQVFGPTFGTNQFITGNPTAPNQAGTGAVPNQAGVNAAPRPLGVNATPLPPGIASAPTQPGISATPTPGAATTVPTIGTTAGVATPGVTTGTVPTAGISTTPGTTVFGNNSWNWPTNATVRTLGTGLPPIRQAPRTTGGGSTSGAGS